MKILGCNFHFDSLSKEAGKIFGYNHVLRSYSSQREVYIHKHETKWSLFTGLFRQCVLFWRWKFAYLSGSNGSYERILVFTHYKESTSSNLNKVFNKQFAIAELIEQNHYEEIHHHEYLKLNEPCDRVDIRINHPITKYFPCLKGKFHPYVKKHSDQKIFHIFRIRGFSSYFKAQFLERFSSNWRSNWKRKTLISKSFSDFSINSTNEPNITRTKSTFSFPCEDFWIKIDDLEKVKSLNAVPGNKLNIW